MVCLDEKTMYASHSRLFYTFLMKKMTLECFCNSLQPCIHIIWAKHALELLVFGRNRGLAWQKMLWLAYNAMYDSHPRLYNPPLWTNLTFECFCSSLQSCTHVIWARVALKLSVFGQIWGQLGTKLSVWMKRPCTIPIPGFINLAHEPILTLKCFRSIFQPFAHVIWAKSALELLVLGQNWRSAWQKMLWLA